MMMDLAATFTLDDDNPTAEAFGKVVETITRQFMDATDEVPITFALDFVMEDGKHLVKGRISSNNHAVQIGAQLFLTGIDKDAH